MKLLSATSVVTVCAFKVRGGCGAGADVGHFVLVGGVSVLVVVVSG